jgi:hypothetical protein
MKTFKVLVSIDVPDDITPEMLHISGFQDGYFINANTAEGTIRDINNSDDGSIEYCTDTDNPTEIFLVWGIGDLETKALKNEVFEDDDYTGDVDDPDDQPKPIYDRTKFPTALRQMGIGHDCNCGITWETIDYFLDEYCLISTDHPRMGF